ncbi:MAG TPA: hypothetical protein ENJ84_15365 [Gammaproteobacteria bacterium]|nr:hypothetical protein [Gammaproteobacteria bacterium]
MQTTNRVFNKRKVLTELRSARSAQIQWRSYTQALTNSPDPENTRNSAIQAYMRFSQWYDKSGKTLSELPAFDQLNRSHKVFEYLNNQMFELLLSHTHQPAKNWFQQLVHEVNPKQKALSRLMPMVIKASNDLLSSVEKLEREIKAMPEQQFNGMLAHQFPEYEQEFMVN